MYITTQKKNTGKRLKKQPKLEVTNTIFFHVQKAVFLLSTEIIKNSTIFVNWIKHIYNEHHQT